MEDDIVWSLQKYRAVNNGCRLTTYIEHKRVLLSNYYVGAEDGEYIEEDANTRIDRIANNIRGFVYDADQSSGYPSDTLTANVSKDTTMREIVTIGDIDKDDFKLNNINLIFGKVNHVDYVTNMMNFPTLQTLADMVRKEKVS